MGKKYILEPDGNIRDSDTGLVKIVNNSNETLKNINKRSASLSTASQIKTNNNVFDTPSFGSNLDFLEDDQKKQFLKAKDKSSNESFDFIRQESKKEESYFYTPFNYIYDDEKPEDFATEFEILTGVNLKLTSLEDATQTFTFMFTYFATLITQILAIEAIILINNAGSYFIDGNRPSKEQFHLIVGKYTVNDYDIFTRYITNVLNYPWKKSTLDERITAYFFGFNEWIAPESILDLSQIVKDSSNLENTYDFAANLLNADSEPREQLKLFGVNYSAFLTIAVVAAVEQILESTLNFNHVRNRVKLLTRKFKQESYWKNELLNKAKLSPESDDGLTSTGFLTQMNYYFIKFYIERVQVGLKILHRYVLDDSYLKTKKQKNKILQKNRVSGERTTFDIKIDDSFKASGLTGKADIQATGYSWYESRSGDFLYNPKRIAPQTTSVRALPQMFQANQEFFDSIRLNEMNENVKVIDSIKQNFYKNGKSSDGESMGYRIPKEAVAAIEEYLEGEYVPFYFHDVRTNEIISFHAFIESISDSFNPEYNTSSGFGRIDDVRSYIKTTRNINLSFTIAATSPEDHDLMWYQINKLVSMVYPQWSDAYDANTGDDEPQFKYPFTQVPTASPLIRLRVGDVITSNYSRFALSRLHGVGHRENDDTHGNANKELFANDVDKKTNPQSFYLQPGVYEVVTQYDDSFFGGVKQSRFITLTQEEQIHTPQEESTTDKKGFEKAMARFSNFIRGVEKQNVSVKNNQYVPVQINDPVEPKEKISLNVDVSKIKVCDSVSAAEKGSLATGSDNEKNIKDKFKSDKIISEKNPIVKSYESGMSKGLAGFITQLDVNYNEVNWEVGRSGSKAPMLVKITINYAPIHDIPPGLDHTGMMRAPVYNVGTAINTMYFDKK
jgi:hypothetical protein